MDMDSSPAPRRAPSPRDAILQRLAQHGVPQEYLDQSQPGLVAFIRENKSLLPEIVCCILPSVRDTSIAWRKDKPDSAIEQRRAKLKALFSESLLWMQWLMFEGEPHAFLKNLAEKSSGQRAVCGAVWGQKDLAYHCRTCEYDPTCAICVPCFQNGDHKDHDYSILYTNGGCCDCGDVTAWKREGFCSRHKGSEQIQPLPTDMVHSIGPVLDELFLLWKDKILSVEYMRLPLSDDNHANVHGAHEFSLAIIDMLLIFCNSSESLLSFVAKQMFTCVGLLDVVLMGERFLDKLVVKKMLEVLLKFIGEPLFKYEFAKAFMRYYQRSVREIIKEYRHSMLEEYPLLSTFSVQIFTVATLTPRLVREINLLDVLLGCLWDIFLSCVGEDDRLQAAKWANLYEITFRLIEDICYVLSHEEVLRYVSKERLDISRSWIRLLSLLQGMDAQKRVRGVHTEEENENLHSPFLLVHYLGKVHALLVNGFFSVVESKGSRDDILFPCVFHGLEDDDRICHAKVGRLSQESFVGNLSSGHVMDNDKNAEDKSERYNHISVPVSGIWLITECLKAVESWVSPVTINRSNSFSMDAMSSGGYKASNLRKKIFRMKKGSSSNRVYRTCLSREVMDVDQTPINHATLGSPPIQVMTTESREEAGQCGSLADISDTSYKAGCMSELSDENSMEIDYIKESETPGVLSLANWPDIVYDVSSQEISFHIPLHRLLSKLFQKAMSSCYAGILEIKKGVSLFPSCLYHHEFFGQVLGGFHPYGFSAFMMEHPLRLRVFCAQVHAGMWRRNGDAATSSSECYRSSTWLDQGLEFDLFLLQCCGAVAPSELFVKRIQERFGLSEYTSLNLTKHDKFEAVLVQEMLILIIQIVKERRFCGLSTFGYLCRELIHRLAAGDATRSQLLKVIPLELSKSEQFHRALDTLAVYSNPSGMKQGKYALREVYWKELDLYHPRWNARELQAAEERYGHFCNVSALNAQLPQWSEIYCPLITVSTIATSRSALQIIRAVLYYALFADVSFANRAPDSVLITALHLLSLALDICEKSNHFCAGNSECMDGQSCINTSCYSKDLLLVLSFACEEFDVGATDGSPFWKNQNMLSLLVSLMRKYREGKNKQYTEAKQCNVSSLIETLLKKFVQLSAACKAVIRKLEPELICNTQYSNMAMDNVALDSGFEEQRAKIRERQAAILEKMRAEQSKFMASMEGSSNDDRDALESNQEASMSDDDHAQEVDKQICSFCRDPDSQSPLCYLIHLQTSKLTSFVDRGPLSWEDDGNLAEAHLISKDALDILSGADSASTVHSIHTTDPEFAYGMDPTETSSFLEVFIDRPHDINGGQPSKVGNGAVTKLSLEMVEFDIYQSVISQTDRTKSTDALDGNSLHSASHGAEGLEKGKNARFSLVGEYLSSLSREASKHHQSSMNKFLPPSNTLSNSPIPANQHHKFGSGNLDGIYISSCGHVVHQECHARYLLSLKQRIRSIMRLGIEGGQIVNPDMGELLCPVCRRFTNSILPTIPVSANKAQRQMMPSTSNAVPIVISTTSDDKGLHLQLALTLLQSTAKMVGHDRFLEHYSGNLGGTIEPVLLESAVRKLCLLHYPRSFGILIASGRLRPSLMLWNTLTYSLMSLEIAARDKINPRSVGSNSCLETLYSELQSSTGSMLSSLLCISQNFRSINDLEVLLRFRAIQLLSESICFDVSGDINLSNKGPYSSIPGQTGNGATFPDMQFWKRAVDPILAYDPFSSLMLVLFSLPLPFLSSTESFMALVHLFYVVSVIQAMLSCYNNCYFDVSCFGDWILNDVCKVIGRSETALKYFFSESIYSSVHPKDVIRRLTLPYLRRCALLRQLIESSYFAPSCNSSHTGKGLITSVDNTSVIENSYLAIELTSVRELEKMFQICSLEGILKDELVRTLTRKWCRHFCEKFKVCKREHVYYCSPAIPFKLMQLPQHYHDLLQRYVKRHCSHCKSIPDEPALCLLCGKLCSPSWKYCCRESRCLEHAMICGAGIGVFLLVRKTTILLQRSVRLALWPSPYLDAYGEEDLDMARGEPLYLNEDRYKALAYMVASHSFDHSSEILHQTAIGAD